MNNKTSQQIKYNGVVKVSIQKDGKIISTKTYHNAGTKYLYQFLCYCLAGDFTSIKNYRPFKIKLFKNTGSASNPDPTQSVEASSFISVSQQPDVLPIKNDDQIVNYKTVLHFVVPYSYIFQQGINQVCLYSMGATTKEDYSAIYYFINSEGDEPQWTPIDDRAEQENSIYNLIIEWEMSFEIN